MTLPTIAIVGRPNVGKSSLFNSLAGRMISIVDPTAGVTRDRVTSVICYQDKYFELADTGGYGIVDSDQLSEHIEHQIFQALAMSSAVVFVVDVQEGITALDKKTAELLRKYNLKVILVANKADTPHHTQQASEFLQFGFGEPICISVTHHFNNTAVLDRIVELLEDLPTVKPMEPTMKIAIVGKRNAGKSTFVNAIVGYDRVIASEVPGTTRDAVDVRFEKDGRTFIIIDTAGVRKKGKMDSSIEFYGFTRAEQSVKRADIVILLIDAATMISQVDKKLAHLIVAEYKPCILVVNKWDLARKTADTAAYADYLGKMFLGLQHAPIAFTTATETRNIQSVIDLASELFKQYCMQIPTPKLNKAIEMICQERMGGSKTGLPKIYYATQVSAQPVSILLFVNRVSLFDQGYQRFILNRLREILGLEEVPVRLLMRERQRRAFHEK